MYAKIFFCFFASLAILSAWIVVFSRKLISKVLCLALLFVATAALWI